MQPALKPQTLYTTTLDSPADINRQLGGIETTAQSSRFHQEHRAYQPRSAPRIH